MSQSNNRRVPYAVDQYAEIRIMTLVIVLSPCPVPYCDSMDMKNLPWMSLEGRRERQPEGGEVDDAEVADTPVLTFHRRTNWDIEQIH
ncbi:hypothetical protein K7432_001719 [Basidiobolus ranarum]|uniref:Uncharacterized protein n=1 Tax=Basidiobolus ranarum TaxID=34480 RepID=A0ABR2W928_9FUNG